MTEKLGPVKLSRDLFIGFTGAGRHGRQERIRPALNRPHRRENGFHDQRRP